MVKSMTGFGHSQVNSSGYEVSCELKSVNHRYFDLHARISRRYGYLEDRIKEELKKNAKVTVKEDVLKGMGDKKEEPKADEKKPAEPAKPAAAEKK